MEYGREAVGLSLTFELAMTPRLGMAVSLARSRSTSC